MRFYRIPKIGDGSDVNPWRPKYLLEEFRGMKWGQMDVEDQDECFVGCEPSPQQRESLERKIDVVFVGDDEDVIEVDGVRSQVGLIAVKQRIAGLKRPQEDFSALTEARKTLGLDQTLKKAEHSAEEFGRKHELLFSGKEVGKPRGNN